MRFIEPISVNRSKPSNYTPVPLEKILLYAAQPGHINLITGASNQGKTAFAILLTEFLARNGFHSRYNLPILKPDKYRKPVYSLSSLQREASSRPPGTWFSFFIDEAAIHSSGRRANTKEVLNLILWSQNYMRKSTGGSLFLVVQDDSLTLPLFRDKVVVGVFEKPTWTILNIDFPRLKNHHWFPSKRFPLEIPRIPLPEYTPWSSEGPSPFDIDLDIEDMDTYIAKHLSGTCTGQAFRDIIIQYLDYKQSCPNVSKLSGTPGLRTLKSFIGAKAFDKLSSPNPLDGRNLLAEISGLAPNSIPVILSSLRKESLNDSI